MDWLEQELKQAMARKDPSPDFAARVEAQVRQKPSERPTVLEMPRKRVFVMPRWVAAAAAVVVIAGSAEAYRWHRGLEAKRQVMEAMRLTAEKLNHIQARVNEARK
jgi:hypothetical protein